MRRIVPLGICPNGTIFYPIRRQLFGAGSSPMTVGMSCKSPEVQTLGNRQFGYLVGAFLQVILFFRLDKRDVCCRPTAYSRHPFSYARTASASVLRPPRRAGAGKAVFSFDSALQFVVERFDKLEGRLRRRRRCLWARRLSAYKRDSAFVGLNAQCLVS